MPVRKPLSLWIYVSMLGLSAAAMPWLYRSLYPPIALPRTLSELTELLSQAEPELLVIPVLPNRPASGVWVCERPQSRLQLMHLHRTAEHAYRWQGVVFCERAGEMSEILDTDTWGEYGMQIGPLLFFGDPALLRRIHKVILDHQGEKRFLNREGRRKTYERQTPAP